MTAVVTTQAREVVSIPSKPPAPQKSGFARSLEKCEQLYVAPLERPIWQESFRAVFLKGGALCGRVTRQTWERAHELLAAAPPAEELQTYLERLEGAAEGGADEKASRGMVGMLLDAYPHGRPTQAFADTLLHDLVALDFSPEVVATACQTVRRSCKFAPSVAEVVDACRKHQGEFSSRLSIARRVVEFFHRAKEIAKLPPPEAETWRRPEVDQPPSCGVNDDQSGG